MFPLKVLNVISVIAHNSKGQKRIRGGVRILKLLSLGYGVTFNILDAQVQYYMLLNNTENENLPNLHFTEIHRPEFHGGTNFSRERRFA